MADKHGHFIEPIARAREALLESARVKQELAESGLAEVPAIAAVIHGCFEQGGKLLFCGNGGSAADAQHFAAELLVRLRPHVNREALPALALAMDTSSLTACGNDYDFECYYERMVEALGRPGDLLAGISTSGKSPNIVRALAAARERGLVTIGLLGGDGGPARTHCDYALVVPSSVTARVQEAHVALGHVLIELVEDLWLETKQTLHADATA